MAFWWGGGSQPNSSFVRRLREVEGVVQGCSLVSEEVEPRATGPEAGSVYQIQSIKFIHMRAHLPHRSKTTVTFVLSAKSPERRFFGGFHVYMLCGFTFGDMRVSPAAREIALQLLMGETV